MSYTSETTPTHYRPESHKPNGLLSPNGYIATGDVPPMPDSRVFARARMALSAFLLLVFGHTTASRNIPGIAILLALLFAAGQAEPLGVGGQANK